MAQLPESHLIASWGLVLWLRLWRKPSKRELICYLSEFLDCHWRFDLYDSVDTDRDGWIQINYEQFMKVSITRPTRNTSPFLTKFRGLDRAQCSLRVLFDASGQLYNHHTIPCSSWRIISCICILYHLRSEDIDTLPSLIVYFMQEPHVLFSFLFVVRLFYGGGCA